jgi:predicted RNA binding protein YcfA (HicA-like mRNA interferase family)
MKVEMSSRCWSEMAGIWIAHVGSHRQYKHSTKPGLVTLPGKPGDDLATGTLNSVLKQAGLKQ